MCNLTLLQFAHRVHLKFITKTSQNSRYICDSAWTVACDLGISTNAKVPGLYRDLIVMVGEKINDKWSVEEYLCAGAWANEKKELQLYARAYHKRLEILQDIINQLEIEAVAVRRAAAQGEASIRG